MDIQNKKLQTFILLLVSNFSYLTFANDLSNLGLILKSFDTLALILSTCLGILFLIVGVKKLKDHGDNPNSANSKPKVAIASLLIGALCFNLTGAMDVVTTSIFGENNGYCSAYADLKTSSCFDTSTAEVMKPVEELMNDKGFSAEDKKAIDEVVSNGFLMFKIIGIITFLLTVIQLRKEPEKPAIQQNYGKLVLAMFGSTMMINLQNTILVIQETLLFIGFS